MISKATLQGYIFEEVLAKLFQASGFDLLVEEHQDPAALTMGPNGLRIRGRGADHQVDVLGELATRIPFTFPLRVFVEAKHRTEKVGLAYIRNAVGVINDVNEHYSNATATDAYQRYDYRYLLFSTSGFTEDAAKYAIAQRISLVDLNGPAFEPLIDHVDGVTGEFYALAEIMGVTSFPIRQMRESLRRAFGTWTVDLAPAPTTLSDAEMRASRTTGNATLPPARVASIAARAAEFDEALYFAFNDSPYIHVARPDEPEDSEDLSASGDRLFGRFAFAGTNPENGEWTLVTETSRKPTNVRFAPSPVIDSLVGEPVNDSSSWKGSRRASSISLAVRGDVVEVGYAPKVDASHTPSQVVRRQSLEPELAYLSRRKSARPSGWTQTAFHELVRRLEGEGNQGHALVLQDAARSGGRIVRDRVYALCGYPPDRMLRGFTRPPARIARDLVKELLLPPDAEAPISAVYEHGVSASSFEVPQEFTWFV